MYLGHNHEVPVAELIQSSRGHSRQGDQTPKIWDAQLVVPIYKKGDRLFYEDKEALACQI